MSAFLNRLFGRTSEPVVPKATYDEIHSMYLGKCDALKETRDEAASLAAELTNARRSNQASMTELMTLRFKNAELVKEIAELKPDAEHWRHKLRRDRERKMAQRQSLTGIQRAAHAGEF